MTFFLEISTIKVKAVHASLEADTIPEAIRLFNAWASGYCAATGELPQLEGVLKRSKRGTKPTPLWDTHEMGNQLELRVVR